jgi:hypothetical protein
VAVGLVARRCRERARLQSRFGREYGRTVADAPSHRAAERDLAERERMRETLDIRPLSQAARERYTREWRYAEARFVDDPGWAAGSAAGIVRRVLEERGYPVDGDVDEAKLVSVDHPELVERYRHGHAMLVGSSAGQEETENLRKAMVDFRAVFEQLLEEEHAAVS